MYWFGFTAAALFVGFVWYNILKCLSNNCKVYHLQEFIDACADGNLDVVQRYLEGGVYWSQGLSAALSNNQIEVVRIITEHGHYSNRALVAAAESQNEEILQMLVDAAVRCGDVDAIKRLTEHENVESVKLKYADAGQDIRVKLSTGEVCMELGC